jgi:hypothetical protein
MGTDGLENDDYPLAPGRFQDRLYHGGYEKGGKTDEERQENKKYETSFLYFHL